jgi:L-ascorbate metabolism protein UlaG (beta-lactamase superfamily)
MNQFSRHPRSDAFQLSAAHEQGRHHRTFPGVKITQVHADHSSEMILKDASGKDASYPAGEPIGLIIELENGFKTYHMGDTGLFGDMNSVGEYYKPDLLLIPIGGHYVMSPKDAAYATRE